jgi:lytic murein transglycosylase
MRALIVLLLIAFSLSTAQAQSAYRQRIERDFQAWLASDIRADATRAGVSQKTFTQTVGAITLDWGLPDLRPPGVKSKSKTVAWQAEFGSPVAYFKEKRLSNLAQHGRRRLAKWAKTLAAIEARYGVPAEIIVAIWGRESSFGDIKLPENAVRAIATQAFMGRRETMYREELVALLVIIQQGDISAGKMGSSWAGAMGQPQFLPTIYLRYAVDFDGDGRRDIWNSVPDSLASIANFLRQEGWRSERGWGLEAKVPSTVSCTLGGPKQGRLMSAWAGAGVTQINGRPLPVGPGRDGFLFMPAGRAGPGFIVTPNFYTLKSYNFSDNYALYVGHLADRMSNNRSFKGNWATTKGIQRGDVRRLQLHLESQGYNVGGADGLVGFRSRIAIGQWQEKLGRKVTCFPDRGLLKAVP